MICSRLEGKSKGAMSGLQLPSDMHLQLPCDPKTRSLINVILLVAAFIPAKDLSGTAAKPLHQVSRSESNRSCSSQVPCPLCHSAV